MDKLIGHQVRGYEISEQLGGGGYGAVYRAFQPAVGRDVAIKVILPQHASNPEFTRRFEVEAQLVAQLEHPHIVPLYDYWQDDHGAFLVMRLVRGGSLRDRLAVQGRLDLKQVLRVYDHIGAALDVSHAAGVIHRDIKPDNILLDQYDNAYLTDFGIAKNLNLNTQLTFNEDSIIGTPAYLAPEQIRNEPLSSQTDIYSCGLMLYELVTGKQPFDSPGMGIIISHLEQPVPSVLETDPDLPPALDDIIHRAAAKKAADRYASVTDLVQELREVCAPAIVPILPYEAQPRFRDPNRHVFIAYSAGDTEFIQRLVYDLESEGIAVWADKQHLKPGTRGWEDSRREAIRSAYAVLLVASPETRRSNYVLDELAIADMYGCPVYPVWAAGDRWDNLLPPDVITAEYIDARADQYDSALRELVMLLGVPSAVDDAGRYAEDGAAAAEAFVPRNPYKGLRAFREADLADFFGRGSLVNTLLDTLNDLLQPGESRLLAVIGPSGSGKSSVVMAGLLPALRQGRLPDSDRWTLLPPMVPGARPLENLALALAGVLPTKSTLALEDDLRSPSARGLHLLARQAVDRQNSRLVLYVDQFEELFTQTDDEAERQQFINLLLTAASEPGGPVVVLLTLRADFYDRPMNYPELGRLIERNSKAVLPLSLAELYSVIQKPATLPDVRLQFDTGLVAELVFEVRGQPGGLPLLQFTLDQLFERRSGLRLTNAAYEDIGGVRGALAKHTEATYERLPSDEHRRMVRGLFLRLIEPGTSEQDTTRRRAPRSELVLADDRQNRIMDDVVNAFVTARLLLADQSKGITTIELSHEALIREWPRLNEWLVEARADIFTQQNISADTAAWITRGRRADDDGLYRGMLLEDAQNWAARNLPSSDEMAFIQASAQAQAARQARDAAIARRVQNFRRAAALLGVMSAVAIIAFIGAVVQVGGAQSQLGTATVAQGLAIISQSTAVAQVDAAQTDVADVGQTLTPISQILAVAQTDVAGVAPTVQAANQAVGDARTQVAGAEVILTRVPQTLTPIGATLVAAETGVAAVGPTVNAANFAADTARTEVAHAGLTLTPIPRTLTPIAGTLAAAEQQVAGVQPTLNAANTEIAGIAPTVQAANQAADIARTQAADAAQTLTPVPQTLTPISQTLVAAEQQIAGVQPTLASAQTQVAGIQPTVNAANFAADTARTAVADTGLTLTPIPLTLTPIGGTLAAAETQVAGVQPTVQAADTQVAAIQPTVQAANQAADIARTQVADAGLTLTPIPLTLTPIGGTLAAAETQVAGVQPTVQAANFAADTARTAVADTGLTLTPIPLTLTPIGGTLAAAETQVAGVQPTVNAAGTEVAAVQPTVRAANQVADTARTAVADAGETLTPIGGTLAAAETQVAGVQPTVQAAGTEVAAVRPTVQAANRAADAARTEVANAGQTLTPIPQTLTPIGGTLVAAETQVAGVQPTVQAAGTAVAAVEPTVNSASTQVAAAGAALTPLASTLVAANTLAAENASQALSQSLAVNAEQAVSNENYDLALVLALESLRANPELVQSQRLLSQLVYASARFSFDQTPLAKLSPDGRTLVTVSGAAVTLWDIGTRTTRLAFTASSPINTLDLSPDGTRLVTGAADGKLALWDMASGQILRELAGHTGAVNAVQFSPDGGSILSGGDDNVNIIWSAADGAERSRYSLITGRQIIRVQYDVGGQSFWSWERANQEVVQVYWLVGRNAPRWSSADPIFDAFDPRNRRYAFSQTDRALVIWDGLALNKVREFQDSTVSGLTLTARSFSPAGSLVLAAYRVPGTAANRVVAWDFSTSTVQAAFEIQNDSSINAIAYSHNGSLAALAVGRAIALYDMANFRELQRFAAHTDLISRLEFDPTGQYLLSFSSDGNARVWDVTGGDPAEANRIIARTQNNRIAFPGYSPDGQTAFGVLRVSLFAWNTTTGQQVNRIDIGGDILGAAYSATQPYALTILANSAALWDLSKPPNQAFVRYFGGQNDVFKGTVDRGIGLNAIAAFSPDGRYLVTDSRTLSLRDITTNGRLMDFDRSLIPSGSGLVSLAVSPDNRYLLGAYAQSYAPGTPHDPNEPAGGVIVWDISTGQALRQFGSPEHNRRINHVTISPDSRLALTASGDGTLIIWDIETGRLQRRLAGHRAGVNLAYFLPDGQYAVSASDDTTLVLWNVVSGQLLRRFYSHTAPVTGLAVRSDGTGFISSTGDDQIIVWELESVEQTINWTLQNRFVRILTCEEGRQFNLDRFCST